MPDLKPLHKQLLESGLKHWRKRSTEEIIASLKPVEKELLKVKKDGIALVQDMRWYSPLEDNRESLHRLILMLNRHCPLHRLVTYEQWIENTPAPSLP